MTHELSSCPNSVVDNKLRHFIFEKYKTVYKCNTTLIIHTSYINNISTIMSTLVHTLLTSLQKKKARDRMEFIYSRALHVGKMTFNQNALRRALLMQ